MGTESIRTEVKLTRWYTTSVFFVVGFMFAAWTVNIPSLRDRFGLSPFDISMMLWVQAGGAVAATLILGNWRWPLRVTKIYRIGGIGLALAATLMLAVPTYAAILLTAGGFGMATAFIEIAMNAEAGHLEKRLNTALMSTFHGTWSVGCMTGATVTGVLSSAGSIPWVRMGIIASVPLLMLLLVRSEMLLCDKTRAPRSVVIVATHKGRPYDAWLLGGIAIVGFIGEGGMYSWSVIYLRDVVHTSVFFSNACYAVFAGGMALARFAGDSLRNRLGPAKLMRSCSGLACVSAVFVVAVPNPFVALAGFFAIGVGVANIIPLLFAAAARADESSTARGMAHVAGLGYIGVFAGPVLVGGVIRFVGLSACMLVLALCSAVVAVTAPPLLARLLRDSFPAQDIGIGASLQ
jgi:predicted MFS family arabinose efflux permease